MVLLTLAIVVGWVAVTILVLIFCRAAKRADTAQAAGSPLDLERETSLFRTEQGTTSTSVRLHPLGAGGKHSDIAA